LERVVKLDEDGWITLHVSRLAFPPWCCDCGAPTLSKQPFRVHHQTGFALILVPVCEVCQRTYLHRYRLAFWKPFLTILFVVAVAGFVVGTLPAISGRDPKSFPILSILCLCATALISSPFAWFVINRRVLKKLPPLVQFRRYVQNRNITFRFHRREYTADVLAVLGAAPPSTDE
jgi:hypothetical protein